MTVPFPRPLLYVAGPYTRPDPVVNTNAACKVGMIIYEFTDWCPVIPHLSMLWHAITPRAVDHWYQYDLHVLAGCHSVVRLPGESSGADREMEKAAGWGMTVIEFDDLPFAARCEWNMRLGAS